MLLSTAGCAPTVVLYGRTHAQYSSPKVVLNVDSDTNVIEVAMRRLRMKIDEGHAVKLIQTVRGMGYVLDVPQEE